MGDSMIDQDSLEDALRQVLKPYLRDAPGEVKNPRTEFYNKFKREAEGHDKDFVGKWSGDLDITLLFAGLLSGVISSFIASVQTQIQPDYTQLTFNATLSMAEFNLHSNTTKIYLPDIPKPDNLVVNAQALLFASLGLSLFASLAAILGKQWLNRYSQSDKNGSPSERGWDRRRKMEGMDIWYFNLLMECLPLMIQFALLLLGTGLSLYYWTINHLVARVITGFTGVGFLFYIVIIISSFISYNCPYQTFVSRSYRFLADRSKRKRRKRAEEQQASQDGAAHPPDGNRPRDDICLTVIGSVDNPFAFFGKGGDWKGFVWDSSCIDWMFDRSTDEDAVLRITEFIPEVIWHKDVKTTPLQRLYDTVIQCFDSSSGHPVVKPKLRNKAFQNAKALLHVAIHRKCHTDLDAADKELFRKISKNHQALGTHQYREYPDLESTLGIIDLVFKDGHLNQMCWKGLPLTNTHQAWMSRIMVYRTWYTIGPERNLPLPEDVKGFVLHVLQEEPLLHLQASLNCFFIAGLVLGIEPQSSEEPVPDMSAEIRNQIDRIYHGLVQTLGKPNLTDVDVKCVSEAMELIAPLSGETVAARSYDLFHVIMGIFRFPGDDDKWKLARLALHGAYNSDDAMPPVNNPQDVMTFLDHHFEAYAKGQVHPEAMEDALRALTCHPHKAPKNAAAIDLSGLDVIKVSFFRSIHYALRSGRSRRLRECATLLLSLIGDRFFSTPNPVMGEEKMEELCATFAAIVDDIILPDENPTNAPTNNNTPTQGTDVQRAALAVLLHMMNSNRWLPCISKKTWELLSHFAWIPEDSEPLGKCLKNRELVARIPPDGTILWLKILWLWYTKSSEEVQRELETATKREDIKIYADTLEVEFRATRLARSQCLPLDENYPILAEKQDRIEGGQKALVEREKVLKAGGKR